METVNKLLKGNVIDIIKPGTNIELLNGVIAQIKLAIVYPDNSLMYEIQKYTETGQVFLGSVYPSNIKNHDKLIQKSINVIDNDNNIAYTNSMDIKHDVNRLDELLTCLLVGGQLYGVMPEKDDNSYRTVSMRYDSSITSSYGYLSDRVVLPNDTYIKVSTLRKDDRYEVMEYITRIVELKPFYKRWFNTLKYGRSHPDNFSYIEADDDYLNRIVEHISSSIKARGCILYNKSSIRL